MKKPRLAAIKPATAGLVFAGTPHRGAEKAKWAAVATSLASLVLKDNNDKVVQALERGSETLERLQNDFSRILMSLPVLRRSNTRGLGRYPTQQSQSHSSVLSLLMVH